MCGLIGAAGNLGFRHEGIVKELLIVDAVRGRDSTGMAFIKRNFKTEIVKEVGGPVNFLKSGDVQKAFEGSFKVLMGHNRFATRGGVSRKTAHPFHFGTIIGMHNGTLTNTFPLGAHDKHGVDSEYIFSYLSQHTVKETFEKVQGSVAAVWWNSRTKTLNFVRNKDRTLFYCYDEEKEVLFWASEEEMLQLILARNSVEYEEIYAFIPDTHYSFFISGAKKNAKKKLSAVLQTIEFKKVAEYVGGYRQDLWKDRQGRSRRDLAQNAQKETKTRDNIPLLSEASDDGLKRVLKGNDRLQGLAAQKAKSLAKKSNNEHDCDLPLHGHKSPTVDGTGRTILTRRQFEIITNSGCAWCSSPVEFGDWLMFLDSENSYLCAVCYEERDILTHISLIGYTVDMENLANA